MNDAASAVRFPGDASPSIGAHVYGAREVFRDAVRQQATAIVAVHNRPSGDPTPSSAGQLLDIEQLDHLIIGQGRWISLKRLGPGLPKS
jgi:DNA repair protein RadC